MEVGLVRLWCSPLGSVICPPQKGDAELTSSMGLQEKKLSRLLTTFSNGSFIGIVDQLKTEQERPPKLESLMHFCVNICAY